VQYTLNGGGAWTTAVQRLGFTASQGPTTFSVGLPVSQDITQVQVRELLEAVGGDPGESALVTSTIANIKMEVVTYDASAVVMM